MCRFLLLASSEPYEVRQVMGQFVRMCQQSRCLDGDWQGDGWGVAWQLADETWQLHRSVAPIWTETDMMQHLPPTRHLVVHARSASFPEHKGNLVYSQPYLSGSHVFVFNGFLLGVRLPRKIPGAIGAEKIWYLVQEQLAQGVAPQEALDRIYALLTRRSREIRACNMGLSTGHEIAFCNGNPRGIDYYQLHHAHHGALRLVCSEPFGDFVWQA